MNFIDIFTRRKREVIRCNCCLKVVGAYDYRIFSYYVTNTNYNNKLIRLLLCNFCLNFCDYDVGDSTCKLINNMETYNKYVTEKNEKISGK